MTRGAGRQPGASLYTWKRLSLSRGPGRKPGASSYTRKRLSLTGARVKAWCLRIHAEAFLSLSHGARAKAWCLRIHAEASLSLAFSVTRVDLYLNPQTFVPDASTPPTSSQTNTSKLLLLSYHGNDWPGPAGRTASARCWSTRASTTTSAGSPPPFRSLPRHGVTRVPFPAELELSLPSPKSRVYVITTSHLEDLARVDCTREKRFRVYKEASDFHPRPRVMTRPAHKRAGTGPCYPS